MKRQVEINYKTKDGIEMIQTVNFNESLLSFVDFIKNTNATIIDIVPNWSK